MFWGVESLFIPTLFAGLRVYEGETNGSIIAHHKADTNNKVIIINSEGQEFYVVATVCMIFENKLEFYETSLKGFGELDKDIDHGNILARF